MSVVAVHLVLFLVPSLAALVLEPPVPLLDLCVVVALVGVSLFLLLRRLSGTLVLADPQLSNLRGRVSPRGMPCLPS